MPTRASRNELQKPTKPGQLASAECIVLMPCCALAAFAKRWRCLRNATKQDDKVGAIHCASGPRCLCLTKCARVSGCALPNARVWILSGCCLAKRACNCPCLARRPLRARQEV
eukprot:15435166-Alexandrium_andersonii.AAC.1